MKPQTQTFRTKLFLYFVLFAAVIFSFLWIMQTVGLQRFYDEMMKNNIRNASSRIAAAVRDDDFLDMIDQLTLEDSLLIYITDEAGNVFYSSDAYNSYFRQTGGSGHGKIDRKNPFRKIDSRGREDISFRSLPDNYDEFLQLMATSETGSVEYASGNTYICGTRILLDDDRDDDDDDDDDIETVILYTAGSLEAEGAAVSIIRTQLLWGTGISLVLGFLIAWILSRRFAKPVSQLTEQAKMLSEEHYEDRFQKGFCRELDDLNDSLSQSAGALSEAREYQKELLANVSHDLRTPLTMIKGYAEMVRDISWSDEAQRCADTGVIIREADRLSALVNEILEYSRLRDRTAEVKFSVVNLSNTAESIADRFEPLFRNEGGIIEREITPGCVVNGDPELLERAVFNLMDNAVRHSEEGNKRVRIAVRKENGKILLEVRDYGKGIDPEELPHIWEKYYTSRQRGGKGISGLGLAIVKQIAVLHQAAVSAESVPGEGSCFRMEFK